MTGLRPGAAWRAPPLGVGGAARVLTWVIALMAYVAALAGAGVAVLADTVRSADRLLPAELAIEIPAEISDARLQTVLALLRQTAGIAAVHLVTPAETAKLLEPWLGPAPPLADLPVPRLIDAQIGRNGALDLPTLRQHLAAVAPNARLDDQAPRLAGLHAAARRIAGVLGGLILGALVLAATLAVFATRSAMQGQRRTVELLHLLGAADGAIADRFALGMLAAGLAGGALGGAAMIATVGVLGRAGAAVAPAAPIAAVGPADWRIWAIGVVTVLIAGLASAVSARVTVRRRLLRLP